MAKVMEKQDAYQSAAERLTAALDVIEKKFDHLDEFAKQNIVSDELDELQKERLDLKSELNEARTQARKLASANQDVANRLNSVIQSLKSVLGNG